MVKVGIFGTLNNALKLFLFLFFNYRRKVTFGLIFFFLTPLTCPIDQNNNLFQTSAFNFGTISKNLKFRE